MKELKIKVEGMVCGGCEKRIVTAVSQEPGIKEVIANYQDNTVIVKGNDEINENDIKEKIEDLGFEVKED